MGFLLNVPSIVETTHSFLWEPLQFNIQFHKDLSGFSSNCDAQWDVDAMSKTHSRNLSLSKNPSYQMSLGEESFRGVSPLWILLPLTLYGEV